MLRTLASGLKCTSEFLCRQAIAQSNVKSSLVCGTAVHPNALSRVLFSTNIQLCQNIDEEEKPSHWMEYNDKIHPPQGPTEERRPAYICHEIKNIKYSPKKMWIAACLVRGLSVDEALKQLNSTRKKGSAYIAQAIKEAVDMAIKDHNVEYRSNLWVAESFAVKGPMIKGIRKGAKGRITAIRYRYVNYYIRLEEGQPPDDYYCIADRLSGPHMFEEWMSRIRKRRIINSL